MAPTARNILISVMGLLMVVILIVIITVSVNSGGSGSSSGSVCPADYEKQPPLILVSMDGFRANYRARGLNPVLERLADEGINVPFMEPSYPSVTFPNHYTIVTGLYPESHGIIANKFYDSEFQENFTLSGDGPTEGRWWGGEPIWNTAINQGLVSGTYFWPGSEADIGGQRPTYWFPYNSSVPFEDRVDQVLDWVQMPEPDRPALITLYFNEPDHTGHAYGPDSDEINEKLIYMDTILDRLVTGLNEQGLKDCVNLIVLADHGMAGGGSSWLVDVQDFIPQVRSKATTFTGAFTRISLNTDDEELKHEMMENLTCSRPDVRQYEKGGLPLRLHFSNNDRIEDIILDFDPGRSGTTGGTYYLNGNHAYDNYFTAMNALFVARGPAFKKGAVVKPFQNLELYNMMCHIMGIKPAPNNGTWGSLNDLLTNPAPVSPLPKEDPPPAAPYPDDATVTSRLDISDCPSDLTKIEPWLSSLSFSDEEEQNLTLHHLPWGVPHSGNLTTDFTLLYHSDHVTGYSQKLKQPLWSSFTLVQDYEGSPILDNAWTSDVRLDASNTAKCSDYSDLQSLNYTLAPLFPPELSQNGSLGQVPYLISNAALSTDQQQERWMELMGGLVPRWLGGNQLNVIVGPVYDRNNDSLVDDYSQFGEQPVAPSDWFAIVTMCASGGHIADCLPDHLTARAFIYPLSLAVSNCLDGDQYALEFSSKVKDVELVTGLTFYPDLEFEDRVRLQIAVHPELF